MRSEREPNRPGMTDGAVDFVVESGCLLPIAVAFITGVIAFSFKGRMDDVVKIFNLPMPTPTSIPEVNPPKSSSFIHQTPEYVASISINNKISKV
jgi:hypothetical protein